MGYREIFAMEVKEILRLWSRGHGYRSVARLLELDRKTVRRYVETARVLGLCRGDEAMALDEGLIFQVSEAVKPGRRVVPGAMRDHCRAHRQQIEYWLDEGCKGPKVVRLLARHTGVVVPLRTLQRFIAQELGREGRGRETVRIVDPPPGQELEVDFLELGRIVERGRGRRVLLHALLCTAVYSRHQFVWPCLEQKQPDVIEGLEAAWRFFGGVFPVVIFDNLKAVVQRSDPICARLNPGFLEYAQARGFEVDPARKRSAQDKARVERQVQYVRNDYFRGESFGSLEQARQEGEIWCLEQAGQRIHGTTRRRPLEVFEAEERSLLRPKPTEVYDQPRWQSLHVGRDHAVVVGQSLYSVPYQVGVGDLRVRRDRTTVKLYRGAKLIKVHPRMKPGKARIDPADLPPGKAELATRDGDSLRRRAAGAGAHVEEYARRLLDSPLPWTRMRYVYRLLALVRRYGGPVVDEACERALELEVVDVMRIDRMLKRGLVQRGLLRKPPSPRPDSVVRLRFARDPMEYRRCWDDQEGDGPDASA